MIPCYEEIKGHPPLYHARLRKEILDLDDNAGLNTIAKNHADAIDLIDLKDKSVLLSFNTPEELERIIRDHS